MTHSEKTTQNNSPHFIGGVDVETIKSAKELNRALDGIEDPTQRKELILAYNAQIKPPTEDKIRAFMAKLATRGEIHEAIRNGDATLMGGKSGWVTFAGDGAHDNGDLIVPRKVGNPNFDIPPYYL